MSPRSKLVLWLWTYVWIMAHFQTIKALDLTSIIRRFIQAFLFLFLVRLSSLSCIYFGGWKGAFLILLVFLTLFLLFFFPSFLERLKTLETWQWFCSSDLRFFRPEVFHGAILALAISKVGWLVALEIVLIHFFSVRARPESQLGLGINSFFDHLIETFQFKVSVF